MSFVECITRPGIECPFLKKGGGCTFPGGKCPPIVEQCEGCQEVQESPAGKHCRRWFKPEIWWGKEGEKGEEGKKCPNATHLKPVEEKKGGKKVNPQKAARRSRG